MYPRNGSAAGFLAAAMMMTACSLVPQSNDDPSVAAVASNTPSSPAVSEIPTAECEDVAPGAMEVILSQRNMEATPQAAVDGVRARAVRFSESAYLVAIRFSADGEEYKGVWTTGTIDDPPLSIYTLDPVSGMWTGWSDGLPVLYGQGLTSVDDPRLDAALDCLS